MKPNDKRMNQITDGSITKALMLFFFPILFGTFFQQLYNTTDAVIVGQFVSKEALGAVGGATGTLINLLVGFFTGLSSGASVVIAQYYGGKKEKETSHAVHTAIALSLVGGLILMVFGIGFTPSIIKAMHTPEEILPLATTYIRIYFVGIIPNLLYNMGSAILRAIGDSKRPLYFLIISCLTNIGLDLLFVALFRMGTAGVAIATILSQFISSLLVLRVLMKTDDCYRLKLSEIKFRSYVLKRIFYLGLPAGIQSSMYAISNVIIQSFVNDFGIDMVAAWTAYGKIDCFFWMMINALGIAIATVVGQNYGALKMDRVKRCVKVSLYIAFGMSIGMSLLLYFTSPLLLRLFTDDVAVLKNGIMMAHYLVPTFLTYVTIEVLVSTLRGCGISIIPMIMTCCGICALRIVWIYAATPIWPGINTVLTSYPLTWTVTSILFVIYYLTQRKKMYTIAVAK
ncbi:MAG: MATE family efflux transporter [Clostridiales bacterium]|nr:MATE family efflux transporter [Clostridiales bacterium]